MPASPRSISPALPLAALLLSACQVEPAANIAAENTAGSEVIATAPGKAASANPPAAPSARYRFTGTEPFWGGTIDGETILYRTPDDIDGKTITSTVSVEGPATRYSGTLNGQPFILTLTPGTCSDGMSDTIYPLSAALTVHSEQRKGCANPIVGASTSSQTPPEAPTP